MSKRYGRNQKRRARERIATLEKAFEERGAELRRTVEQVVELAHENGELACENRRHVERIMAIYDAVRDDSMLKPPVDNVGRVDPMEQHRRYAPFPTVPATPYMDAPPTAYIDEITQYTLSRLDMFTDEDWDRRGYHVEASVGREARAAVFFDARALQRMPASMRMQYLRDQMGPMIDLMAETIAKGRGL